MTNNDHIQMDTDVTYEFTVTEDTIPIYSISPQISNWLTTNLTEQRNNTKNIRKKTSMRHLHRQNRIQPRLRLPIPHTSQNNTHILPKRSKQPHLR